MTPMVHGSRSTAVGLLVARLIPGGILVYAGFLKALAPAAEFAAAIANYKLLPASALLPVSTAMPWIEMWVGLFLIVGLFTRWAARAAAVLYLSFVVMITTTFLRGISLESCGCFGSEIFPPQATFGIDVGMLVVCLLVAWSSRKEDPTLSLDTYLK